MTEENEYFEGLGEEEESRASSTIHYNTEDFISTYKISEDGTVPSNILEFQHSFAYDCRKLYNLCVADPDTLVWASGNLIHFFNVSTESLIFRRCSTGGGIGHITKNQKFEVLAVGENGIDPPIIVYEWPTFEIAGVLKNGTTRSFTSLRFSPDGLLLVSQGGDPDYLITVWDWQKSKIRLQCKSHGQDVYNVVFSSYLPGHMTSCGAGHIKCWKMAETFTGLKLQGELGRFGKTEISDIFGVYPMPDEKVISGCEWGNILIWDEGLIKIEVCRKNQKPCHNGYVTQFEFIDEELISIGTDGFIRFWFYETIDHAEPTEESHYCDVEPIMEIPVGDIINSDEDHESTCSMLLQIIKKDVNNKDDTQWYAQDGNGGIWLIQLSLNNSTPPKKLLSCHSGGIMDMDVADWGPYVATIDAFGKLHIYNYREKTLKFKYMFSDKGSCIHWLPISVEASGCIIVCGFLTGVIRMFVVNLPELSNGKISENTDENFGLLLALKPHTKKVTCIKINPTSNVLVTGSEDATIFIFKIESSETYPQLTPIGFIEVPSSVSFITWRPGTSISLFAGCTRGECVLVDVPEEPQDYTTISLKLSHCTPKVFQFESVKSAILREKARVENERDRAEKIVQKKAELKEMLQANPGLEMDEDIFIEAELGEEPPLPEIYIPEVPNAVLGAFFTDKNTVVLFMSGYDAGYSYEYSIPEPGKPAQNVRTEEMTDCEGKYIRSFLFFQDGKYVVFGMEDGVLRVCKVKPEDDLDFSDYWTLSMHDNSNGSIPAIRLSYDEKVLITCGYDGNIFSYGIYDDKPRGKDITIAEDTVKEPYMPTTPVRDIEDSDYPSLEEVIVKTEYDRIMANAKADKERTLNILHDYSEKYNLILKRNLALPVSQRFTDEELEIDPRITADLTELLRKKMDLVYKKFAYEEEKSKVRLKKLMNHFIDPITCMPFAVKRLLQPETMVHSLRELKLTDDYKIAPTKDEDLASSVDPSDRLSLSLSESSKGTESSGTEFDDGRESPTQVQAAESFLKGLSPRTVQYKLGEEINHMLKKYRSLKSKLEEQDAEWKQLLSEKPSPKQENPEDEEIIRIAKNTIGDYKLKANLQQENDSDASSAVKKKFREIVLCRRKIHFRREEFNDRLKELRGKKLSLKKEVEILAEKLQSIRNELPEELHSPAPNPIIIDQDVEFPEKNLELESYMSVHDRIKVSKKLKRTIESSLLVENIDEEFEVLLLDENYFKPEIPPINVKKEENVKMIRSIVPPEVLTALRRDENTNSALERELKRARATRKLHEQKQILDHIHKRYAAFDSELDELEMERVKITYESVYMDLYLLTMHQELIVLRNFEKTETELTRACSNKSKAFVHVDNRIKRIITKIEDKNANIIKLRDKIKENYLRYMDSVAENRFALYLKKICRKKYKPPKSSDDECLSSSESDSSTDDDSNASEDSEALALASLDETKCPVGCDRELYDEAFIVRNRRYDMEYRIKEELRHIDVLQKDLDNQRQRKRSVESELEEERKKLDILLAKKQTQLNDIDITVVLKLSQLQCFIGDKAEKIQNCILFDKTRLSELYARVGELKQEIFDQNEMHKSDKAHLKKMENDCRTMKQEFRNIKQEIKKEMLQKFGQQVSLTNLYESVLRRMVYEIKANAGELIKFYDEKINVIKQEHKQQLQVLNNLIQDNTEKLSFLTVLEEELFKLNKALKAKVVSEEELCKMENEYGKDLFKLKSILKNQELQKDQIRKDIRRLSLKSKNLAPLEEVKPCKSNLRRIVHGKEIEYPKSCYMHDSKLTFAGIDDSEYYKKIIAVRHLLSQITAVEKTDVKETIQKMLEEIANMMRQAGYSQEEIDKSISEIIDVTSDEGADSSKEKDDSSEN